MSNRITEDIKNRSFARVYVLYGEEDYLKRVYRHRLTKALVGSENEINLNVYHGSGQNVKEIIELLNTPPFFSEYRMIILDECSLFNKNGDALAAFIPQLPEETVLLIVEGKLDKKEQASKLFKAIKTHSGVLAEQKRQRESDLMDWAVRRFYNAGKKITRPAMTALIRATLCDMETLAGEMDKLIAYTGDREAIRQEDVDAVTCVQMESRIFDLMDTVALKQTLAALQLYRDLLGQKVSAVWILSKIAEKFNELYQVKQLRAQGFDRQSIADKCKMRDFLVTKALRQCEYFTLGQLNACLKICLRADEDVKYGRMKDVTAVEMVLLQVCSLSK